MDPDLNLEIVEPAISSQTRTVVIVVAATIAVAAAGTYFVRKFRKSQQDDDTPELIATHPVKKMTPSN